MYTSTETRNHLYPAFTDVDNDADNQPATQLLQGDADWNTGLGDIEDDEAGDTVVTMVPALGTDDDENGSGQSLAQSGTSKILQPVAPPAPQPAVHMPPPIPAQAPAPAIGAGIPAVPVNPLPAAIPQPQLVSAAARNCAMGLLLTPIVIGVSSVAPVFSILLSSEPMSEQDQFIARGVAYTGTALSVIGLVSLGLNMRGIERMAESALNIFRG